MMKIRALGAALGATAMTATMVVALATPATADKYKDCGTQPAGHDHMYQTETQISACNSSSDTGSQTGPVTNHGGGTPPGQQ